MAAAATVVGFGEALFDVIGNEAILGGAPLNFAVHVRQLFAALASKSGVEGRSLVVSRVGDDDLGRRLRRELAERNVDVGRLQIDPLAPTGTVTVELDANGHPTYDVRRDAAWDRIEFSSELANLARRADVICFGTLVQRTEASRQTLGQTLAAASQAMRVCDLNLRAPRYSAEIIQESAQAATVLKLNEDELRIVCQELGVAGGTGDDDAAKIEALTARYPNLQTVAVTFGANGARLFHAGRHCVGRPPQMERVAGADTVGAGDSWCAALVVGLLQGLTPQTILAWANHVAALVASRRGATPCLPAALLLPPDGNF